MSPTKRKMALLCWRLRLQTSGIFRASAIPGSYGKTGGAAADAASRPGLAPESALRVHPCRALPSAPARPSVGVSVGFVKRVVVVSREK
jgi:hypothetical protein